MSLLFLSGRTYHFVRLMGRSASLITLECAMQTHPNYTFIGESSRVPSPGESRRLLPRRLSVLYQHGSSHRPVGCTQSRQRLRSTMKRRAPAGILSCRHPLSPWVRGRSFGWLAVCASLHGVGEGHSVWSREEGKQVWLLLSRAGHECLQC